VITTYSLQSQLYHAVVYIQHAQTLQRVFHWVAEIKVHVWTTFVDYIFDASSFTNRSDTATYHYSWTSTDAMLYGDN